MSDTILTADKILKEAYVGKGNEIYKLECPLFSMVEKRTAELVGKNYLRIPLIYAPSAGISNDFAIAQANGLATNLAVTEFQVLRTKTYGVAYVDGELIKAAETDAGAFLKGIKPYLDAADENLARNWEICAFGEGYGVRGQLSATQSTSTNVVTLADPSDARNFEEGQRYDLTHALGASAAKKAYGSSGAPLIVDEVDIDAGTVTFTCTTLANATNGIPTVAASDYLVLQGGVAITRSHPCGLKGYCPDSKPSSGESFFGADRSSTPRLYGSRITATSGQPITESINRLVGKMATLGTRPDKFWTSFNTVEAIVNSLQTKVQYVEYEYGTIGFRGVRVSTPKGDVDVFGSVGCSDKRIYGTDMSKFGVYSLGAPIHVIDDDGLTLMRAPTSDAVELRKRSMGNYGCTNPAGLGVIILP